MYKLGNNILHLNNKLIYGYGGAPPHVAVLPWTVYFSGYTNGTYYDDTSNTRWTSDGGQFDTDSWWQVMNGFFEGRDMDAYKYWESEVINISSYGNVNCHVSITEVGSLEADDCIYLYYKLNGGVETLFATFGNICNNFGTRLAQKGIVNGNTQQIIIRAKNNSPDEYWRFPYVKIFQV